MVWFASSVRMFATAIPLMAYRAIAGGMPILLGLFIAYQWGLEELAAFTVANAAVAVAVVVTDWGATRGLPRNLTTLPAEAAVEMLASANLFRSLIVGVLLAVGVVAAATGSVDASIVRYLAILFPLCPLILVTTNALSERVVSGQTHGISVAVAAGLLVFVVLGVAGVALGLGPRWLVGAYVTGKVVEAIVMVAGRRWVLSMGTGGMVSTAAALWPFCMQMVLAVIYTRLAVFTVERLTTRAELGIFSLAAALQTAILLIPSSLALLLFPELTRQTQREDRTGVRRIMVQYVTASAASVAVGVAGVWLGATYLGARVGLSDAFVPFVVCYGALAFLSIFSMIAGFQMQANGGERTAARLSLLTLALALGYQVAALHAWGLWGIVVAIAAAELTAIAVFGMALRRMRRV